MVVGGVRDCTQQRPLCLHLLPAATLLRHAQDAHPLATFITCSGPLRLCVYARMCAGKLLMLLQQGKRMVQEGALTALASVADCSQEEFVRYYDSVMPLLSNIMLNAQQKEHRWGGTGVVQQTLCVIVVVVLRRR